MTRQIEHDLATREKIEKELEEYVHKNRENDVSSGIRLIYCKNYPWSLDNDGFKKLLFIETVAKNVMPYGWLNKTGINFQEHVWFLGYSIYIDKEGIFFSAGEGRSYRGFRELRDKRLVMHMPFSNIVNFDFKEYKEYEPVFYIRYRYNRFKKLY